MNKNLVFGIILFFGPLSCGDIIKAPNPFKKTRPYHPRVVQDETGSCPYLRGTWLGTCEGVDTDPLRRYRLDLDQGACTLFMVQGGNNFRIGSPQAMPSSSGDRLTRAQWQDDARQVLFLMESWQQNEKSFQRRYEFNALTGQAQESLSLMGESAQNLLSCQYTKMK